MLSKSINFIAILFGIILSGLVISGCSSEEEASKSMEQIQKEEGFPVVVEQIKLQNFGKYLTFYGQFKGYKETTIGAAIGGRIEKINALPGSTVKEDQVIIEFPEDAPASQYQQAKSAFLNSKKTYERMQVLHAKGEIAQAQFDGVKTKFDVDKRNYETMKDMLKLDAPYTGVLTEVMVHEGDNVKGKAPLFTVAQLNKMKIRIWLSDGERMQIKKGMSAIATVAGHQYSGKVSDLSMSVDAMKQAFYADLLFDNQNREILPGLTADVRVILYENKQAIAIPHNLVQSDISGKYVYLADGSQAKRQNVTILNESGLYYEIGSGIKSGDPLIIKGNSRLADGSKIKVIE